MFDQEWQKAEQESEAAFEGFADAQRKMLDMMDENAQSTFGNGAPDFTISKGAMDAYLAAISNLISSGTKFVETSTFVGESKREVFRSSLKRTEQSLDAFEVKVASGYIDAFNMMAFIQSITELGKDYTHFMTAVAERMNEYVATILK